MKIFLKYEKFHSAMKKYCVMLKISIAMKILNHTHRYIVPRG